MKDTNQRDIRTVGRAVEMEYITLEEAAAAKGCTKPTMLKWCEAHNVRLIKRPRRWLVHRPDLSAALQQELADDAS